MTDILAPSAADAASIKGALQTIFNGGVVGAESTRLRFSAQGAGAYPDPGTGSGAFMDLAFSGAIADAGRHGIHLTTTAGWKGPSAMIAMGLDYGGVGIVVRNKTEGGTGFASGGYILEHGVTLSGSPGNYDTLALATSIGFKGTSYSTFAPLMKLIQTNPTTAPNYGTKAIAPALVFESDASVFSSATDSLTQKFMQWLTSSGERGFIDAASGLIRAKGGIKVNSDVDNQVTLWARARSSTQTANLFQATNDSEVPQVVIDSSFKLGFAFNNLLGSKGRINFMTSADPTGNAANDWWFRSDTKQFCVNVAGTIYRSAAFT